MYPIIKKEKLADKIYLMDVKAERVAKSAKPGQFVIVKIDEEGERIPLTICDYDEKAGTVTIVFQTVGASTERMAYLEEGDTFQDFVGPLGCPSDLIEEDIEELKKKKIVFIAGGVGTAPMLYLGEQLAKNGHKPTFLLGARSDKDLLQLEEFVKYGEVYTTTEDGSHGEKGYVTQHSILNKVNFEQIYTCGPKPMMISVAKYAKSKGINCEVSLENMMACGIGACLCCVENTTEGHLCVCKEGPVFNINKLLWQI